MSPPNGGSEELAKRLKRENAGLYESLQKESRERAERLRNVPAAFGEAMRAAGLTERTSGADADWRLVVSKLGDVLVKIDGEQDGQVRATVTAEYMGKNLGDRHAVGVPAILEAIQTARDGIQAARKKLAGEVVAKKRGLSAQAAPELEAAAT